MNAFAGTRLATAAAAAAIAGAVATQVSDAVAVAGALVLAFLVAARSKGRALAVAPAAVAAAVVGVVALPDGVALASAAAASLVSAAFVLAPSGASGPPAEAAGGWTIEELSQLVEANAAAEPARAEEWRAYVELLRTHAVDGVVPAAFDELVAEVFGELLDRQCQSPAT